MCGIAGICGWNDQEAALPVIQEMTGRIHHRGPDARDSFAENGIALGHARLSIIDLSEAGKQPMECNEKRFVIVYNGEIYNHEEVRKELKDYPFKSNTDTEVLLAAFKKWGPDCLEKMNGMFAFAIWDRLERKLFIARDRMGIKPLYYTQVGSRLIFCSEIRPILASGIVSRKLNKDALVDFLRYQTVHGPATMVEGVKMLPPGHYAWFREGNLEMEAWWDIVNSGNVDAAQMSEESIHERIRELLFDAVKVRKMSDVPLGAFLSGGMDSSAIVALLAQASEDPVDTFSIVFREKAFDESEFSSLIAQKYNTRHHPILVKPELFLDELPSALHAMDHPSGDGINSYVVSGVTKRQGITVALSGLGGDELFAGYPVFRKAASILKKKWIGGIPAGIRKPLASVARKVPGGRVGSKAASVLEMEDFNLEDIYQVFRTVYQRDQFIDLNPDLNMGYNPVATWLSDRRPDLDKLPFLSRISAAEIQTYTGNVLLRDTDQMSMAHALEVRVPFFDHRLYEFVLGVVDAFKFPHYPKQLMHKALGELLPDEIVHRHKMGFTFPWVEWLKGDLRKFSMDRIERLDQRGIFKKHASQKVWQDFLEGRNGIIWSHVWLLLILEEWMTLNQVEA